MASQLQMPATLGVCMSSNKIIINAQPCMRIAQLNNKSKSTRFTNLVAKGMMLFPLASVGQKKPVIEFWKQCQNEKCNAARAGETSEFTPHSLIKNTIEEFYDAFNVKNIDKLKQLVSKECEYQDYLFYSPYKGRENVIKFWQNVMEAMGPNIKIAVQDIKVDDDTKENMRVEEAQPMATVFWHLEWGKDKKKLPFTKGCRFFWFKKEEGRLVVSKITGLEELPLKPGELVLNVLKAIRTFLDSYPPLATALLNSPTFRDD